MQSLVETITKQIIDHSNIAQDESIVVNFQQGEDMWIAQNSFIATLKSSGYKVYSGKDSIVQGKIVFDVTGIDLKTRYDDTFRESFLGTKKIKRTVIAALACQMTDMRAQEVIFSKSFSETFSDTVMVDQINTLELPSAKSTHAELPSEDFFDRILEPFVIIGATGVAIYLFFHVRS